MIINFLGDSITEGCAASFPYNNYVSVVGRTLNITVNNYGVGGTRIAKQTKSSENPFHDQDFIDRVDKMTQADMIVVFGGTNDFAHGDAPFGDVDNIEPNTFCGACYELYEKLTKKYKNKPILIVLPIHRTDEEVTCNCKKLAGETKILKFYYDAIKEIAGRFKFNILDLWEEKELNPNLKEGESNFWDGLHPNDRGHNILGEIISKRIKEIINKN